MVYEVIEHGFKYNLPDVNAAVGVAQFQKAWGFRQRRQDIAARYTLALSGMKGVRLIRSRVSADKHSYHLFPIVITDEAPMTRDDFIEKMSEKGIGTSVHYRPLHHMTYYREIYSLDESVFPNTEEYWRGCVSLPLYPDMSDADVEAVVESVTELLA